jgi:hypothetical protein
MSGAQEYYDSLMAQGYTPEQAKGFTQQHFPGFSPAAAMPAPMPAAPQPMAAPMAAAPQMGMPMGAPMGGMMPAPQMAMQSSSGSSPIGYIAVVCVVITLALSTWGVIGGNWVVPDDDDEMPEGLEYQYTLREAIFVSSMEDFFGIDYTCEEYFDLLESDEDYSKSDFEDELGGEVSCVGDDIKIIMNFSDACEDSDDDESCEAANAGLTGTIILWVAIGVGLIATLLIVFNVFNIGSLPINTQKFGMIAGISSGVLVATAVVVWMIMIPDLDGGGYGLNVWLTFAAAATGIVGGILVKTHGNPSA